MLSGHLTVRFSRLAAAGKSFCYSIHSKRVEQLKSAPIAKSAATGGWAATHYSRRLDRSARAMLHRLWKLPLICPGILPKQRDFFRLYHFFNIRHRSNNDL